VITLLAARQKRLSKHFVLLSSLPFILKRSLSFAGGGIDPVLRAAIERGWKLSDLKPFEKWPSTVSSKIFNVRIVSGCVSASIPRFPLGSLSLSVLLASFSFSLSLSFSLARALCLARSRYFSHPGTRRKVGALRVRRNNGNLHRTLGSRRAVTHTCPRAPGGEGGSGGSEITRTDLEIHGHAAVFTSGEAPARRG